MNSRTKHEENPNPVELSTQAEHVEEVELAEARQKGSLLFRLWAEAREAYKESQQQRALQAENGAENGAETGAETPDATNAPEAPPAEPETPPSDDTMPPRENFLARLRIAHAMAEARAAEDAAESTSGAAGASAGTEAGVKAGAAAGANASAKAGADASTDADAEPPPELPPDPQGPVLYSSFLLDGTPPSAEQRKHFLPLQNEARKRLFDSVTLRPNGALPVQDACCLAFVSKDCYSASVFVFPPMGGGAEVTEGLVREALARQNITYGILEDMVANIARERCYLMLCPIAVGEPAVSGQDAQITDNFSRTRNIRLVEREDHTVDYKNLNWVQHVHEGDVISEIILDTPPKDGHTVQGRVISGRAGRKILPPAGKNTAVVEEDGIARVVATQDGQVVFAKQSFSVEQLLKIPGDVGNATGNIDVIGNVVIDGNVLDGFTVKATGDIAVNGMVEGAVLIAGGSIQIGMGMNGNSRGALEAKIDIAAKYLENCTLTAGGAVRADTIINCTVHSDDTVSVTTGRGIIIGGSVTALNVIEANIIGNRSSRGISLVLGSTPGFYAKKAETEQRLKDMYYSQTEHEKDLRFIDLEKNPSPAHRKLASDLKLRIAALKMKIAAQENEYQEMMQRQQEMSGCQIRCREIYPPVQVTFGTEITMIREPLERTRIYYVKGEIRFGSSL